MHNYTIVMSYIKCGIRCMFTHIHQRVGYFMVHNLYISGVYNKLGLLTHITTNPSSNTVIEEHKFYLYNYKFNIGLLCKD